jgi:hypothetical protein
LLGGGGGRIVITNNYMDRLGDAVGTHYEHIITNGGQPTSLSMLIQHNTLINMQGWTCTILIQALYTAINDVTIDSNLMYGPCGYCLYCEPKAFPLTNIVVTNNAMGSGYAVHGSGTYGAYLYPSYNVTTWSGNYDYLSHNPISLAQAVMNGSV